MANTTAAATRVMRNPAASAITPATGAQITITPRFIERIVTFVRAWSRSGVSKLPVARLVRVAHSHRKSVQALSCAEDDRDDPCREPSICERHDHDGDGRDQVAHHDGAPCAEPQPDPVVIAAPTSAPTPPAAPMMPKTKGESPSWSRAKGARTTPTIALPTNHPCVETASAARPELLIHPADSLADLAHQLADRRAANRRRLPHVDARHLNGGVEVGAGVDQDGERRSEQAHQQSPESRSSSHRGRISAVRTGVCALQVRSRHQPGQEGHGGSAVDHRRGAVGDHDRDQHGECQRIDKPQQRNGGQDDGLREVGSHQQWQSTTAVDESADEDTEDEVRKPSCRVQQADLSRRSVQRQDDECLQRQKGDVVAEPRDSDCAPVPAERPRREMILVHHEIRLSHHRYIAALRQSIAALRIHDVTRGRPSSSARPVDQRSTWTGSPSGASGNSRASTAAQSDAGGSQLIPRPCVMSYVCTRVSLTPSAAKPPGSVAPQCHARASGPAAASALLRSLPEALTTWSTSRGGASAWMTRSNGK